MTPYFFKLWSPVSWLNGQNHSFSESQQQLTMTSGLLLSFVEFPSLWSRSDVGVSPSVLQTRWADKTPNINIQITYTWEPSVPRCSDEKTFYLCYLSHLIWTNFIWAHFSLVPHPSGSPNKQKLIIKNDWNPVDAFPRASSAYRGWQMKEWNEWTWCSCGLHSHRTNQTLVPDRRKPCISITICFLFIIQC